MTELFAPQVSIAPTRRRRFLWAAWWSGPPVREPFRKPDASQGGARTREEAKAMAERAAGVPLVEIEPRWARAWGRILVGQPPWPRGRAGAGETHGGGAAQAGAATGPSLWSILGVTKDATLEELKQAFRSRAKALHPDHGGSDADFIRLQRAYEEAQRRAVRPKSRRRAAK